MRSLLLVVLVACSNAADPVTDAAFHAIDAPTDAGAPDSPPKLGILVINEVAPGETPDWFEIRNVTASAVQLDQYVYVDVADDFTKAKAFPTVTLPAGGYYTQDVDDTTAGFKLAGDEELWVYRGSDHALVDSVDWDAGAAPTGMSYARSPDTTGDFTTLASTKGVANP